MDDILNHILKKQKEKETKAKNRKQDTQHIDGCIKLSQILLSVVAFKERLEKNTMGTTVPSATIARQARARTRRTQSLPSMESSHANTLFRR